MKKLSFLFYSLMCIGVTTVSAQITVLHNFNDTLGEWPHGSLTLSGNKFYGMTQRGGIYDSGCIFSMDTNGNDYKDLFDFKGINGEQPLGSLTLSGKVLYGMTEVGGAHNLGCIFSIDTNGVNYKKLLDFNRINGAAPQLSSLSLSMGRLYGVTSSGGITHDSGCIFSIDTNGSGYKDLHDFNGTNGDAPCGSLTLYGSALYGMTEVGGAHNLGCIFSIDTNGSYYKDLLDFNTANGEYPYGSLIHSGAYISCHSK